MKLQLLGTGGPLPDPDRHGSCVLVEIGDAMLMFDCGRGAVVQAAKARVPLDKVDPLFITHHHYDHISDIADFVISSWLEGRGSPVNIYGPPGTHRMVHALFKFVYDRDVRFRAEGERIWGKFPHPSVTDIVDGFRMRTEAWHIVAAQVIHDPRISVPGLDWHPLGFRLEAEGKSICISGDTVKCDSLIRLARNVDVLVQSCYLAEAEITNEHLRSLASHTIASAGAAGEIASEAEVGMLVLTHLRRKPPELLEGLLADVQKSYRGKVMIASDLLKVEV